MAKDALHAYGGVLILLLALAIHDRVSDGRFHPVTAWVASAPVFMMVAGTFLVPQTDPETGLILMLG